MSTSVSSLTGNFFPSAENGFTTTTSGSVSSGAATVGLNSVAGYANGEVVVFVIDPTDPTKKQTFTGVIDTSGVQVTDVVWTAGTNQTHALGATVVDYATATHISMMTKGITQEHNQDGTHDEAIITSRTEDTSPAVGDSVLTSDASASGALKKVQVGNLWVNAGGILGATHYYTFDGTDIFVDGVDQNNAANTISWSKPSGLKFVTVEVKGGGGGGGGVGTTSGIGTAGGGGEGARSVKKVVAASLGSTETVTVGDGGAGGVGNNTGTTGGTSSFGSHCTAVGGSGGQGSTGVTKYNNGGNGGSTGTADFVFPGNRGGHSTNDASDYRSGPGGGSGGASYIGSAGNGSPATQNGGGGGSGGLDTATTSRNGGKGGSGYVIVNEYY